MNFNKTISLLLLQILWIGVFNISLSAQKKFEFGIRFDPLVVPVNFGTFIEEGPGFYDIHAKGKITQAAYLNFIYWPLTNWGISLGAGVQNFQSEIEYTIPDPSHLGFIDPVFDQHDQMKGRAAGPVLSIQYRNKHIRASFGLVPFQYGNTQTPHRSSVSGISISTDADVIAHIQIDEEVFWRIYGTEYDLYQFGAAYEVLNRLFLKVGFESTLSKRKYYPYTTRITGFTADMPPVDQLMNDFKMSNAYSAFSLGVEYFIGFGKYRKDKNIDDNAD